MHVEMRIKITFIGWLLLCLAGCMTDRDATLRLQQAGELLEEYPDSALRLLQTISELEEMPARQRALYALLMAAATDKCELPLLPCDSLLHFALGYYSDRDLGQAVAQLYQGRLWNEMNDSKLAIECTLKAWDILQDYPEEQPKYGRLIFSALGLWYGANHLYDKALEAERLALRYAISPLDSAMAFDHIGFVYIMREVKDSALYYKKRCLEYALKDSCSGCISEYLYNLSTCYSSYGNADSAFYYAREAVKKINPDDKNRYIYYSNIGNLYDDREEYDSARYYLQMSIANNEIGYWPLAYVEYHQGNYKEAFHNLERYTEIADSLYPENKVSEVQQLVYKHDMEVRVKWEQEKMRQQIFALVSFFIICGLMLVLFFQYQINRKKRERLFYEQALSSMQNEFEQMRSRIESNTIVIDKMRLKIEEGVEEIEKREQLIQQLESSKLKLRGWLFSQAPIYKKVMALSSQDLSDRKGLSVLSDTDQKKLKEIVFQIYDEFIQEQRKQYPQLTDGDLLSICLEKIGFSSLTISLCFGHTDTRALNKRKSRMKEKMSQRECGSAL